MIKEETKLTRRVAKLSGSARARAKEEVIVLDGVHLVREMIARYGAGSVRSLFVTEERATDEEVLTLMQEIVDEKVQIVTIEIMKKMASTVTPQGILAVCGVPETSQYGDAGFVLILENIQDPTNVGAMIRTGASLGVEAILLTKGAADAWSPRALRASQGAHFYTKIITDVDIEGFAQNFTGKIVGTILDKSAQSLYKTDLAGKVAIAMGNEGAGLSADLQKICTEKVFIPMGGKFESLNVASACAITCAEKVRQDLQGERDIYKGI